ncbi:MAG: DNRLRE domain-containing protein [Bacteroidota bacterium]
MMKTFFVLLFIIVTFLFTISGCSDNPSSLGIDLIPQEDFLNVDTLTVYSTTERLYQSRHPLGSSQTIAVGRAESLEAYVLISFLSMPDTMAGSTVNSVELTLFPNYIIGDSTGTVSFDVCELMSGWSESSFTWDSLAILPFDGTVVGSFTGAVTDSDSVVVSISPQLISKWFSNAANILPTYGLLLKPNRPAAPGQVIRGFESFQGTRIPYIRIIATQNSQIDTFTLSTGYDTYVVNGSPVVDPLKSIYIQPTLGYNTLLTFDVSKLPRDALIHQAIMELTSSSGYSFYSRPTTDSVLATFIVDSTAQSDFYDSSPPISTRTGNVYSMNIATMVQRWGRGFPNQGVRIKAYDDYRGSYSLGTVNPFIFYNSKSDISLRPRLKILYSTIR